MAGLQALMLFSSEISILFNYLPLRERQNQIFEVWQSFSPEEKQVYEQRAKTTSFSLTYLRQNALLKAGSSSERTNREKSKYISVSDIPTLFSTDSHNIVIPKKERKPIRKCLDTSGINDIVPSTADMMTMAGDSTSNDILELRNHVEGIVASKTAEAMMLLDKQVALKLFLNRAVALNEKTLRTKRKLHDISCRKLNTTEIPGSSQQFDTSTAKRGRKRRLVHEDKPLKGFKSEFKGVQRQNLTSWHASIWMPNTRRKFHIGVYSSEIDAAKAHDDMARKIHGDKAITNFSLDGTKRFKASGRRVKVKKDENNMIEVEDACHNTT